jgi:drug/metabolite transporter (DMT)-like permease
LKTGICLLIVVAANAAGNVLLSYGMRQVGSIATYSPLELVASALAAMTNPYVAGGVGLLIVFFVAHMIVLSWADLSYVLPVTAVGYVVVTLLSWWVLGETVRPVRWIGTIVIVTGVAMVGSTPVRTSRNPRTS